MTWSADRKATFKRRSRSFCRAGASRATGNEAVVQAGFWEPLVGFSELIGQAVARLGLEAVMPSAHILGDIEPERTTSWRRMRRLDSIYSGLPSGCTRISDFGLKSLASSVRGVRSPRINRCRMREEREKRKLNKYSTCQSHRKYLDVHGEARSTNCAEQY